MSPTNAPIYTTWKNNTNPSWWKDPGLRRSMVHVLILYCCVFTFGYDGSLLNGLQTMPQWQTFFDHPAGSQLGLISASFYFPKLITPFIASYVADRWGRRAALMLGSVIGITGAFLTAFTPGVGMFMAGRALLGGGLGMQATVAPPLIAELCHPRLRSVASSTYLCTYYVGSTVSSWLCYGLINVSNNWGWRGPCIAQATGTAAVAVYIACGLMAESPRWLINKGREEEAFALLARLHANGDHDDELVLNEFAEIKEGLEADKLRGTTGYTAFLKTPGNRRRLFVILSIAFATQGIGISLVSYYLSPILKLIGIVQPVQQAGINGGLAIFNLFAAVIGAQFVDRLGRRPLWLIGSTGMLVAFSIVTGLSGAFASSKNAQVGTAVIPFLYIFYGFYDICLTILPNLYLPEILPFHIRIKGMSIYVFTQAVILAFNQYVNPIALAAIAWKYYLLYLGIQLAFIAVVWFVYIETKGYTIEEVSRLFDKEDPLANVPAQHPVVGRVESTEKLEQGSQEHVEYSNAGR